MGRALQQRVDYSENKNFYRGSTAFEDHNDDGEDTDEYFKDYDDVVIKNKINHVNDEKKNEDVEKYFLQLFRNITIRSHIWCFIHQPLIPGKKYKDIHSI
ncbi:hypothetical protein CYY_006365, partial [Polysphondylium violaceum]